MVSKELESKLVLHVFDGQGLRLRGSKTRDERLARRIFRLEGLEWRGAGGEGERGIL